MLDIVKDRLDIGLLTDKPEVAEFWKNELKVPLESVLPIGPGHDQHRFDVDGSIVKVNVLPELNTDTKSGYAGIIIARPDINESQELIDPDGNHVRLVPPGTGGVAQLGIRMVVSDLVRSTAYYRDVLGWSVDEKGIIHCGASVLLREERPDAPTNIVLPVRGWTYLTVRIRDCEAELAEIAAAGNFVASEALTMRDVARFAMVRDPDGNQVELSQRASLTGPLPGNPEQEINS